MDGDCVRMWWHVSIGLHYSMDLNAICKGRRVFAERKGFDMFFACVTAACVALRDDDDVDDDNNTKQPKNRE